MSVAVQGDLRSALESWDQGQWSEVVVRGAGALWDQDRRRGVVGFWRDSLQVVVTRWFDEQLWKYLGWVYGKCCWGVGLWWWFVLGVGLMVAAWLSCGEADFGLSYLFVWLVFFFVWLWGKLGSKLGSDTKLMQDNNGKNRINGKRDRNKQNKPTNHYLESTCKILGITTLGVSGITTKRRRKTHLKS